MKEDLVKVRTYIQENIRRTTATGGLPYIDLHDNKHFVLSEQNCVVFEEEDLVNRLCSVK